MPPKQSGSPKAITYAALLAAALFCYAGLGAVLAVIPTYASRQLGAGATVVGLAVGAPELTGLIARPLGGRTADRLGPRAPLFSGMAVMVVGALPAVLSPTLTSLVVSRLLVGAGEGVMMSAAALWLLRLAGPVRRGRALGHMGLANFGGLALGSVLAVGAGTETALWAGVGLPLASGAAAWAVSRTDQGFSSAPRASTASSRAARSAFRTLLRLTGPAGLGLMLVNLGYVSLLSFGAQVAREQSTRLASLIVPIFAVTVIVSRSLGGGIPDRLGARRTVLLFASLESAGLLVYSLAASATLAVPALVMLAVGQSLVVPGLGIWALSRVPAADHGAAAGLFFAWFDVGVGIGGPIVGVVAASTSSSGALIAASAAVGCASLLGLTANRPCRVRASPDRPPQTELDVAG